MAINNPYIPGDPYSYDLKWIVAKVKEILQQLGTLDEAIEAKIFEGFLEHSIVQFQTVPEMLAADIKDGSIVLTLGYHEAGDQGGLFYLVKDFNPGQCSLDYFLTLDNNTQIAIPVIVTPYVTPEMFGAKGDGAADDTDAIQTAVDIAHKNALSVLMPGSEYNISSSITLMGGADNTEPGITVCGIERGNTKIIATETMSTVFDITSDDISTANVYVEHLQIEANNNADYGILYHHATANCRLDDIKINHAIQWGLYAASDLYLTDFSKVRIDNSGNGFKIDGGVNTSLRLADCYVQNAVNAYKIAAIYSTLINCCADSITGTVFDLEHFTGTLVGCGTEAAGASIVFNGGVGTCVSVVNCMTFMLDGADAIQLQAGPGARWYFYGGRLSHSESNATAPGYMYTMALSSEVYFDGTVLGKYAKTNTYSDITARVKFNTRYGDVNTRYDSKLAYLGIDGHENGGLVNPADQANAATANAIYFGLSADRDYRSDNLDLRWNSYVMKGDILLTQDPLTAGCLGWVQCQDVSGISGARWVTGTFKRIPITLSGPTTDRPTLYSTDAGTMYLDTTLIKPVWWTGSRWIDATGTTA